MMGNSTSEVAILAGLRRPESVFRFGIFELDGGTGELRKDGKVRPQLQGQPLELILQLLARPGKVVTREELRKRLWPAETFVDYDHSLNFAVNKLRDALGDSADNPRFVQTLTRQGYRFIAPVRRVSSPGDETEESETIAAQPGVGRELGGGPAVDSGSAGRALPGVLSNPRDLPPVPRVTARVLFGLIQLLYLGFYVALLGNLQEVQRMLAATVSHPLWIFVLFVLTAVAGIPTRLYLLSAALFGYRRLSERFRRIFPVVFPLDEFWALAPFLVVDGIGTGLALAATASLLFLPFSQRSILLMGEHDKQSRAR